MSEWYEPKRDDIDYDWEKNEVNIYVKQNNSGSVYVSLPFKQVKELYDRIAFVRGFN